MPAAITNTLEICTRVPLAHEPAADNILAALAEALFSAERYQLIERNGELYIQPIVHALGSRSAAAVFSPDARARREAFAVAA